MEITPWNLISSLQLTSRICSASTIFINENLNALMDLTGAYYSSFRFLPLFFRQSTEAPKQGIQRWTHLVWLQANAGWLVQAVCFELLDLFSKCFDSFISDICLWRYPLSLEKQENKEDQMSTYQCSRSQSEEHGFSDLRDWEHRQYHFRAGQLLPPLLLKIHLLEGCPCVCSFLSDCQVVHTRDTPPFLKLGYFLKF